jgi:hypothetical protein
MTLPVAGAIVPVAVAGAVVEVWYTPDAYGDVTTPAPGGWMLGTGLLTVGTCCGYAPDTIPWPAHAGLTTAKTTNTVKM